jgi:PBSX family phage portal protein
MSGEGSKKAKSSIMFSRTVKRADDSNLVFDQPLEAEDEFQSLYEVTQDGVVILQPPFNPNTLRSLCTRNNLLQQCIHVMEVNIDGTGHTIEPIEASEAENTDPESQAEKAKAEAFFKEPFPGMSMITLRRKLRVDLEQTGCAYLEALRNAAGELVFLRHVDAATVRMLKLDAPVPVEVKVNRGGEEVSVNMQMRERRFVQIVGQNKIYFREFGSSRQINRKTGQWVKPGEKLPAEMLGNELIQFIVDPDATSPYGVPRWINNLPSILGSRKAEEYNLEFFDAGGLPPAMIIIAGGAMTRQVKEQVLQHLSGRNKARHRAAIIEVQSASGGLDGQGKVSVLVEKFGDSRMGDALFQRYDQATEERVRVAFRLPPLFVGRSGDYSFATAMVSYMVAEEQVFVPERREFDEIINTKVLPALGVKRYKFVSKPITLKDARVMLEAVNLAKDAIDAEERVSLLNEIAGMSMKYSAEAEQKANAMAGQFPGGLAGAFPGAEAGNIPIDALAGIQGAIKKDKPALTANDIVSLVSKWAVATNLEEGEMPDPERAAVLALVDGLRGPELDLFNKILATKNFAGSSGELAGLGRIAETCNHLASRSVQSIAKSGDPESSPDPRRAKKAQPAFSSAD